MSALNSKGSNGVSVLTCKVTIGPYNPNKALLMDAKYVFTECVNIEINDSYKTLVNTAKITLPRDIILSLGARDESGYRENNVLTNEELKSTFNKGDRIMIELGYGDDNKLMFDGFIISLEPKTPFTLYCEDFGYRLKTKVIYPADVITTRSGTKINRFIDELLSDTGISLHPQSRAMNLELGVISLQEPRSLSELLEYWKKNFGLLSFIKFHNGKPTLALSRTYFSENTDQTLISGVAASVDIIDFSENVVKDSLTFTYLDYNTLALEATALDSKNRRAKATIILNPAFLGKDAAINSGGLENEIRVTQARLEEAEKTNKVNDAKLHKAKLDDLKKKMTVASSSNEFLVKNVSTASKKQNKMNSFNIENKFSMSHYNVRTYHEYHGKRIDMNKLIKNAKSVFKNISQTGISGSLTLFGDFGLRSASMVRLFDERNPEKNGTYVVSDVRTTFGVSGYRQIIKLPFKRSN